MLRLNGEGNGKPFQYSCLENPMNRGAWWAAVHRDSVQSDTTENDLAAAAAETKKKMYVGGKHLNDNKGLLLNFTLV